MNQNWNFGWTGLWKGCQLCSTAPPGPHSPYCLCLYSLVREFYSQPLGDCLLYDQLLRQQGKRQRKPPRTSRTASAHPQAVGVTMDEKDYYYQDQLVNIFLDIQPNKSFYTLNMNPKGTVNIKIVRDVENKIIGVSYMTEAEVIELLGDMDDPDNKTDVEIIPVDFKTIAAGETIFLGEYTLSDGDEILYDISALVVVIRFIHCNAHSLVFRRLRFSPFFLLFFFQLVKFLALV